MILNWTWQQLIFPHSIIQNISLKNKLFWLGQLMSICWLLRLNKLVAFIQISEPLAESGEETHYCGHINHRNSEYFRHSFAIFRPCFFSIIFKCILNLLAVDANRMVNLSNISWTRFFICVADTLISLSFGQF